MKQFWQLQFCVWKEVTGNIFKSGILLWGMAVPEAREGRIQKPPWGWQRGYSSRKLQVESLLFPGVGQQDGRHGPKGTGAASGRSGPTGCILKHSAGPRGQQSGQGGGLSGEMLGLLYHSFAVDIWPWINHFTSLIRSFFICQTGKVTPTLHVTFRHTKRLGGLQWNSAMIDH